MKTLPRTCTRCLCYEGMPFYLEANTLGTSRVERFRVLPSGTCTICEEHAVATAAGGDARARMRDAVIEELHAERGSPVVVAVSGGKDSLSTLYLAREVLGLDVAALFYDSGFMLDAVAEQLRAVCARLGIELHERRTSAEELERLNDAVLTARRGSPPPCHVCSKVFVAQAASLAARLGTRHVILGVNHFLTWPEEAAPLGAVTVPKSGRPTTYVCLPYLLGTTRGETLANVEKLGARPLKSQKGLSSNCRVPELVQARLGPSLGHLPELEMLSLEVLVGHLSRADAAAEVVERVRAASTPGLGWMLEAYGPERGAVGDTSEGAVTATTGGRLRETMAFDPHARKPITT